MLYGTQPARRRDAQRNRTAILQAACELMSGEQDRVGMPEIARRAGIGQATLYRHFPDRMALATAVIGYLIDHLERCVAAGRVRSDLVPDDLILLFGMVEGVVEGARNHAEAVAAAGRSIDLALDGVFRPVSSPSEAPLRIGKL
jgi:AcrR family transcriptional regulator